MKWMEIRVKIISDEKEKSKEIITNSFNKIGIEGVMFEEPMEKNPLTIYENEKIFLINDYYVIGYLKLNEYYSQKREELLNILSKNCNQKNIDYDIIYNEIDEQDWENSWKNYFFVEEVGKNIIIKPTWREYTNSDSKIVIKLDPGMAFGTGTHPTTSNCIKALEKYIKNGDNFLDVGTGSGILMVASKKLNAEKIIGIDIDPLACEVAEKNLLLNDIDEYKLYLGDISKIEEKDFDIVTANILSEIISELFDDIYKKIKIGGIFIGSGIIKEKLDLIEVKFNRYNIETLEKILEGEWVTIIGRKR